MPAVVRIASSSFESLVPLSKIYSDAKRINLSRSKESIELFFSTMDRFLKSNKSDLFSKKLLDELKFPYRDEFTGLDFPEIPDRTEFEWPDLDKRGDLKDIIKDAEARNSNIKYYTIRGIVDNAACPGDTVTISGEGFYYGGNPPYIKFPVAEVSYNSFTDEIVVTSSDIRITELIDSSDTELTFTLPLRARCGSFSLGQERAEFVSQIGDSEPKYHNNFQPSFTGLSSNYFAGGVTFINYFRISELEPNKCFIGGEVILLRWESCNSAHVTLKISREDDLIFNSNINSYSYTIPVNNEFQQITFELKAHGPCEFYPHNIKQIFVRVKGRFPSIEEFINRQLDVDSPQNIWDADTETDSITRENWRRNISRSEIDVLIPTNKYELKYSCLYAHRMNLRLSPMGSNWSYTDCSLPPNKDSGNNDIPIVYIDTSRLSTDLGFYIPTRVRLHDNIESTINAASEVDSNYFVHVEAGIKIHELNCLLEEKQLALHTMGGSRGQSLAGAINTSTHGGDLHSAPLADAVRAIHLVSYGGEEWWIEPSSKPITLINNWGLIRDCRKVVYDDDLFYSCLVSFGAAGVVYSYVLECVDPFLLSQVTEKKDWNYVKSNINMIKDESYTDRYMEVILTPTRAAFVTKRSEIESFSLNAYEPSEPDNELIIAALTGALQTGLVHTAAAQYITTKTTEMSLWAWVPGYVEYYTIKSIDPVIELMEDLVESTRLYFNLSAEGKVRQLLRQINIIWKLGSFMNEAKMIVNFAFDQITQIVRPLEEREAKSFVLMTEQPNCDISGEQSHGPFAKLVDSYTYSVGVESCVEFIEAILTAADQIRATESALVYTLNIKFTKSTKAILGIQQFPKTCHVEIYLWEGISANNSFVNQINQIVQNFSARPHWGQLHSVNTDFSSLYGNKLNRWQASINRLMTEGNGDSTTFRNSFSIERGLL